MSRKKGSCWGWRAMGPCKAERHRRGGEGRGWAYVRALDQTDLIEVDFKGLSVAGRTACGGWGYRSQYLLVREAGPLWG